MNRDPIIEHFDDLTEVMKLDTELKREALRQARLANDIAEQDLIAKRIENANAIRAFISSQHVGDCDD